MLLQFSSQPSESETIPVKVFISYSHKDESFKEILEEHLTALKRQGLIESWNDRQIKPGDDWNSEINDNLEKSKIILLLISSSFIASEYCYSLEMKRALEKHDSGEAIVIPVILRPVFWSILPLSKLQALPKNGKPIIKWEYQDEAFSYVTEQLRVIITNLNDGSTKIADNLKWHWILKLKNVSSELVKNSEAIVLRLKEISCDSSVRLVAIAEQKNVLILDGTEDGFQIVETLYKDNKLSNLIGFQVHSFYLAYGSGIQASSKTMDYNSVQKDYFAKYEDLVYRSNKITPVLFNGLFVPKDSNYDFNFSIDSGQKDLDAKYVELESQKLLDYFVSSLSIKPDDLWVNLSEYESNRMIPVVLGGTRLGRDMLEQDCMLKRLTASLLHPDTETGREYWKAVYKKANQLFGTSKIPVNTYQKVWILPGTATVYERECPMQCEEDDAEVLKTYSNEQGRFVYVVEGRLKVKCEEDYYALKANITPDQLEEGNKIPSEIELLNNFTIPIFKEIILPEIEDEVNNCLNFKPLQQIYRSLILAKWFRQEFSERGDYAALIDTNKPNAYKATILEFKPISSNDDENNSEITNRNSNEKYDIIDEFDLKENKEFHNIYSALYRNGLFKLVRREFDEFSNSVLTRIYFSGMLKFSNLHIVRHHYF